MIDKEYTLPQKLYKAKVKWAELNKEACKLEEMRKVVFAAVYNYLRKDSKLSQKDCEMQAYESADYKRHIEEMVEKRQKANIGFAEVEGIREAIDENKRKDIARSVDLKYSNGVGD